MANRTKMVRIDPFQHRQLQAIRAACKKAKKDDKQIVVPSIPVMVRIGLDLSLPALASKFLPSQD